MLGRKHAIIGFRKQPRSSSEETFFLQGCLHRRTGILSIIACALWQVGTGGRSFGGEFRLAGWRVWGMVRRQIRTRETDDTNTGDGWGGGGWGFGVWSGFLWGKGGCGFDEWQFDAGGGV
jgi:hypothetical protein